MTLYAIVASLALLIALAVYITNPRRHINIFFSLFVLMATLWLLGVFLGDLPDSRVLLSFRMVFAFSILMVVMLYYFVAYLVDDKRATGVQWKLLAPATGALILTLATPYVIESAQKVVIDGSTSIVPDRGIAYPLVILWIIGVAGAALARLYRGYREAEETAMKKQIKLAWIAIFLGTAITVTTNVILPNVTGNTEYNQYAPLSILVLAVILSYAILKHHFLNIRLLVARSIAYVLSLGIIALIAAISLIAAGAFAFEGFSLSDSDITLILITAFFVAALFGPLKRFFDRATRRIFLRDAYDAQEVIDRLSSLLATEINLQVIVETSSEIISNSLKPLHMRYVVYKDKGTVIDKKLGRPIDESLPRSFVDSFSNIIIMSSEVENKTDKSKLEQLDAEVLVKLHTNDETVGAILLGPKQSGSTYTKQDMDLLTIMEKELAIAVQNSRYLEQIQEFNAKLQEEIEQATSELKASNTKLKELDEAKDEFISMASHQLRTPLTSVKGYISMVVDGDAGKIKPEQKKLLEEAFASSQRMVYLIADLLNVSRLKTGKFVIDPAEVSLADLVEQEVGQLKPTAKSRKLKLKFDKPGKFPKVWLDETKIRQVVMNFIDNAIYYTPAGGRIDVSLSAKKDIIEFKVKDNGIGVPKGEQPKLFTKFYRAGNARRARPDGTGLGLYMAQRVVSAQGGSIIFKSKENEGSTFGFSFPLSSVKTKQTLLSHTKEPADRPEQDE